MRARFPRYAVPALALAVLAATLAAVLAAALGAPASSVSGRTHLRTWSVAPGVTYSQWRFSAPAGPQRIHVLDIDPTAPGVSLDYAASGTLRRRAPTSALVAGERHAVAGVNGSFFDIADTGAPLGVGRSRSRGLLHATAAGWNSAFYQGADGAYHVGPLALRARLVEHPTWQVGALNTPHARPDSISLYTPTWGRASGRHLLDGRHTQVRQVHVRDGVVRQNIGHLTRGHRFRGLLLVGLGAGARELRSLPVGDALTARWSLDQPPRMAITGSQVLVSGGKVVATNDHLLAPRTAVGLDTDTGHVVVATLDGRQTGAIGRTTRGWAEVLVDLGVDEAVNLDGGGSTTMVARNRGGTATEVVNAPSLGHQRRVADALTVEYRPRR